MILFLAIIENLLDKTNKIKRVNNKKDLENSEQTTIVIQVKMFDLKLGNGKKT